MTLPALEAVRENFPGAHITVLAKPWVAPIFEDHPAVDHVLVYDKGNTSRDRFCRDVWNSPTDSKRAL